MSMRFSMLALLECVVDAEVFSSIIDVTLAELVRRTARTRRELWKILATCMPPLLPPAAKTRANCSSFSNSICMPESPLLHLSRRLYFVLRRSFDVRHTKGPNLYLLLTAVLLQPSVTSVCISESPAIRKAEESETPAAAAVVVVEVLGTDVVADGTLWCSGILLLAVPADADAASGVVISEFENCLCKLILCHNNMSRYHLLCLCSSQLMNECVSRKRKEN
ncbi:hypothetical protein FF38_03354 [Lucilia cuprina]|uniref:Uncharacterized protein n=1 Tax=Lucilia cuprina TaxID=7375 RepID=A0A0L0C3E6_LUCCU|nr:hypothetical protein FF38_03354 [Lucilia cuprina]